MAEAATPFPLAWPSGKTRRDPNKRRDGKFKSTHDRGGLIPITVAVALNRLERELDAIRARYPVVSTNLEVRRNGLPRSGQPEPADPGVAVYFHLDKKPHCLPCDTYRRVADNIAAIAAHIEATRAVERHGVASVTEMFSGFAALPAPTDWRRTLEINGTPTRAAIEEAYRRLARGRHPDTGGSHVAMTELNAAKTAALREIGDG